MAITITEILIEAFNRIKTEHGVTLSRVEFDSSGRVEFSACSNPQVVGVVKRQQWQGIDWARRDVVSGSPEGATHFGSVGSYSDSFWKFEVGNLFVWGDLPGWLLYDAGESAQRIVESNLKACDGSPPYQP